MWIRVFKKQLVEEKKKLETLRKEKPKTKEDSNFKVVKVDDIEKLKQLKHYIELYYSLGYDIEKLYKYLENGTLEEFLNNSYNTDDVELSKQFLEKNGPKLIKRINN